MDELVPEMLEEIESWRVLLAEELASRKPNITDEQLNTSVQRAIDYALFQQICSSLNLPLDSQMLSFLGPVDRRLARKANSLSTPDLSAETAKQHSLSTSDVSSLQKNKYLDVRILGQVYEQFLGRTIQLDADRQVVVKLKPEVAKAGGVYYTPKYIVDEIVQRTLGRWLTDKTPHKVAARTQRWTPAKRACPMRILDLACGSGAFLIGAYEFLLKWYLDQYVDNAKITVDKSTEQKTVGG